MSSHREEATHREAPPSSALGAGRVLVFWEGGSSIHGLPLRGSIVFGRATESDVSIDHRSVSRRHAILHVGDELVVEDLGSANGTRVRRRALLVGEKVRIESGEVIELGSAMIVVEAAGHTHQTASAPQASRSHARTIPPRAQSPRTPDVVVIDPAMQQLHRLIEMVARSPVHVLVGGETGAGKDIVANAIHRQSPRANAPFVCLNCAALPESLLESELFGYERGAFTGADRAKPGLLEAANGGTVFLDELGEMPLATQAKLLRVVENGQVTRLGSLTPISIDVRIVSATNVDLEARSAAGTFRQDLYFRLNGISLRVPPLRDRVSEIVPLAIHFIAEAAAAARRAPPALSPAAKEALESYTWPGNVRELKNVVGQAMIFVDRGTTIDRSHLPEAMAKGARGATVERSPATRKESSQQGQGDSGLRGEVGAFERARIVEALEKCNGNQTRAAELLGISRRTLLSRLDAYGLPRPRK